MQLRFFALGLLSVTARAWIASCLVCSPVSGQTYNTVVDNGPAPNRVDIVFSGDGYTVGQIDTTYAQHVQDFVDYMFAGNIQPFPRYENFFNVHRVNVISNESGADQPPLGIFKDTALDASYWYDGVTERLLYFDTSKANTAINTALAGSGITAELKLGTVNDSKYGGGGGSWGVYAGANSSATDIAIHEMGHSFAGLADEYFYTANTYTGPEPNNVNVTTSPATGKWDRWLGYNDPDSNIGPINYFEGGMYHQFGIFRPSNNSEMRALFRPFDAIGREQFIRRIYAVVDPLDDWQPNTSPLEDPTSIWVDSIDPNVIHVEWSVDGSSLGILGETLDVAGLGLTDGMHSIEARAYDAILDHSFTGDSLDWWRRPSTNALQQRITWSVNISATVTGDFDGNGVFDCADIDALVAEIAGGSNTPDFDLTGDGLVNLADRDAWLAEAGAAQLPSGGAYLVADADLDGIVDGIDFTAWNDNKFTATAAWCAGDFNADGFIDGADFIEWNGNKFTAADQFRSHGPGFDHRNEARLRTIPPVPEPLSLGLLIAATLILPMMRNGFSFNRKSQELAA